MRTVAYLALAAGLVLPLAACKSRKEKREEAEKKQAEELKAERPLDPFTAVELAVDADCEVAAGDQASVKVDAPDDVLKLIDTRVEGGRLRLGLRENEVMTGSPKIKFTVVAPKLESAKASFGRLTVAALSGTAVRVEAGVVGTVRVDKVTAKSLSVVTGTRGSVTVAGTADAADVKAGAGTTTLTGRFQQLTLKVDSIGKVRVGGFAQTLTAAVSASGDVSADGEWNAVALKVEGAGSAAVGKKARSLKAEFGGGSVVAVGEVTSFTLRENDKPSLAGKFTGLEVNLHGSTELTATGTATGLTAVVQNSGKLRADGLQAEWANVTAQNSGAVTVWAAKTLRAVAENAAEVRYKGAPRVDRRADPGAAVAPLGK